MFEERQVVPKYGAKANVIKLGPNLYAVRKYLLSPSYYKDKIANEESRQKIVRKIPYVLFKGDEILDDIVEFTKPHVMDDYDWAFNGFTFPHYEGKAPFPQQQYTARWLLGSEGKGHLINNGRGADVFSAMRTGKSLSCLWAMDAGIRLNLFSKILIVSLKTVTLSTWAKELSTHFPCLKYTMKVNTARDRVSNTAIDIIGHDALTSVIKRGLGNRYDLIIYDEGTAVKNVKSSRYKEFELYFRKLNQAHNTRLWILTGTPVAQNVENAWAFIQLISPQLGPRNLTAWRAMTQFKLFHGGYENKANAPEICANALQPSVRFELRDIIEIEDVTPIYQAVEKTAKQAKMYKQLAKDFIIEMDTAEHEGLVITAQHAAAKASKLLQILAGAVYDEEKNVIPTDATHKLEALVDIIEQLPDDQPVIIFAEWKHTIKLLKDYLTPIYKTVEVIDGSVGTGDKDSHRFAINTRVLERKTKIAIVQPVTGSMGLDFSSTNVVIWFTPTYRAELYQQALERVRNFASASKGFTKFFAYHLYCDEIERIIYEGIREKLLTQEEIFKLIRDKIKEEFML